MKPPRRARRPPAPLGPADHLCRARAEIRAAIELHAVNAEPVRRRLSVEGHLPIAAAGAYHGHPRPCKQHRGYISAVIKTGG